MFRIGIIGTENSHALAFSKIINLANPHTGNRTYEDARIVGVYGPDLESAQQIMDETKVDFIAEKPEDFLGKVDAMMITSRRGSVHYDYAMPFIEEGIPLFIDKPITADYKQSLDLIEQCKKNKVLLTGGSGCKYAYDVLMLKNSVEKMTADNKMITGAINFAADMDSIYDGFFFYAPHLTEMALTVFGYDMKSIKAFEKEGSIVAIARYDNYDVTLNYTKDGKMSSCLLFGKDRNIYREIDISLIYEHEVDRFMNMLRTGKMPYSYEDIIKPVAVIEAILESLETNKEITIP